METLPVRPGAVTPPIDSPTAATRPGATAAAVAAALVEAQTPLPPAPASAVQQAVETARSDAASRQGGIGTLLADLDAALAAPGLPPALKTAIRAVLAQQVATTPPVTGEALKQAVGKSGLFLEAQLAQIVRGDPGAGLPSDLKAALLTLQQALAGANAKPPARLQRPTAPPPTPGASPTAQGRSAPTLTGAESSDDLLQHLRGDVEQALARQTLHQLASLPDGAGRHWMFELPLATPQGPAIAQFAVDEDDQSTGGAASPTPGWQARFSLHLELLGPVHVRLHMGGERTHVTFWAGTPEALDRLRADAAGLAGALDAEIAFHAGAPPQAAPPPGQLVDRTS